MSDERTGSDSPPWHDRPRAQGKSEAGITTPDQWLAWARREAGDRYRIERAAGAGGHSLVFEAFDSKLERPVAIKFLRGSVVPGAPAPLAEFDRALLEEARSMARLRHEGLCPVYEVETRGSVPFLVMEWIDGVTLDQA
ncbi:MAG: hypothetical protein FJ253_09230, partial [Phycisphaerae bacterium]|nr:hypothetical protein [Phycisphaerae bacterium]